MSVLTVTARGQVTLRRDVLRHLGVAPGGRIAVHKLPNGRIEVAAERPAGDISDVFGMCQRRDGRPVLSVDEMNRIIAEGWAGGR